MKASTTFAFVIWTIFTWLTGFAIGITFSQVAPKATKVIMREMKRCDIRGER